MKTIVLSFFCALFSLSAISQNTSIKIISKKTHQVLNGLVDTIYGDGAVADIKNEYLTVMESQDSMFVGIKRVELSIISGSKDYYCWYLCYLPVTAGIMPVWKAADSLWVFKDDTIGNFSVYLQPKGLLGMAHYRYIFYPANNPSDSSWMDVVFNISTVGNSVILKERVKMYPNPSEDFVIIEIPSIQTSNNLNFDIRDILGRTIMSGRLKEGRNTLDISNMTMSGDYLVRVTMGNSLLLSDKLVIR